MSDPPGAQKVSIEVVPPLPDASTIKEGWFRSHIPNPVNIVAKIIPDDLFKTITNSALEKVYPGIALGKSAAEKSGAALYEISRDPELQRCAANLIKMGLIEAAYRLGGQIGGKAAEKVADAMTEAALRKLGGDEKQSADATAVAHAPQIDQKLSDLDDQAPNSAQSNP